MLRTISREGQRQEASSNPPPAAAKRRSSGRIHSARLSDDKVVKRMYNELSKYVECIMIENFLYMYTVLFQSTFVQP